MPVRAHVKNGHLVVDEPTDLPEGAEVDLVLAGDEARGGARVLELAEALSEKERIDVTRALMQSLPEDLDDLDDDLDREELRRRIASLKDGTATLVPWDQAREAIRRDE